MKTSNELSNIAKALVEAQKDIKGIEKNAQGHGYRYMTFDAIVALVKPVLNKHEIFLIQDVHGDMVDDTNVGCCTTRLLHSSGEWMETEKMVIKPTGKQVKGGGHGPIDPQAVGSALTYGKRYQLCGMLGIAADVDDDASVASQKQEWGLMISQEQKDLLGTLFIKKGVDKNTYGDVCTKALGKIKATKECTLEEAGKLITYIETLADVSPQPQ